MSKRGKKQIVGQARSAPAAFARASQGSAPIVSGSNAGLLVDHQEFFTGLHLSANTSNETSAWTIQPGWTTMFPWLSGIAERYEQYRFDRLEFHFRPRVPTSTAGTVLLSVDPDPDDAIPDSTDLGRQVLMSHEGAKENSVWTPVTIRVPASVLRGVGPRFVRPNSDTATVEPRTADLGFLTVGVYGVPMKGDPQILGDLLVSYRVHLFTPHLTWLSPVQLEREKSTTTCFPPNGYWLNADSAKQSIFHLHNATGLFTQTVGGNPDIEWLVDVARSGMKFAAKAAVRDGRVGSAQPRYFNGTVTALGNLVKGGVPLPPAGLTFKAYTTWNGATVRDWSSQELTVTAWKSDHIDYHICLKAAGSLCEGETLVFELESPELSGYVITGALYVYAAGSFDGASREPDLPSNLDQSTIAKELARRENVHTLTQPVRAHYTDISLGLEFGQTLTGIPDRRASSPSPERYHPPPSPPPSDAPKRSQAPGSR